MRGQGVMLGLRYSVSRVGCFSAAADSLVAGRRWVHGPFEQRWSVQCDDCRHV
jgi:hypothetical protein